MITFSELVQKILIERFTPKSKNRWNGTIYGLEHLFVGGEKIDVSHLVAKIGKGDNTEIKLQKFVDKHHCELDNKFFDLQDEMSEDEALASIIEEIKSTSYSI